MLQRSNKSHKTALHRKQPSAPARKLVEKKLITGRTLDYGCGHGTDADTYGWEKYDPYFFPDRPQGLFDTVLNTFVLNVIPDISQREAVLSDIAAYLAHNGSAYITVRADKEALNGWTSIGTWQGLIVLPLPVVCKTSGYVTYEMRA
jgi:hypothetical protein